MRLGNFLTEQDERIKVIILTSKKDGGSSEDLFDTAEKFKKLCEKKKLEHYVAFAENSYISKKDGEITIHNSDDTKGFKIHKNNTVVVVRGSVDNLRVGLDLLAQLENNGIFCINGRESIEICADKYRTILALEDEGISCPRTALITNEDGLKDAFQRIGSKFPCILKTLTGSKGIGVFFADSWMGMKSTLQAMWKINENTELIIQEYIEAEFDMRIHVLNGEVIAAMKRFKIENDFRSNYSLGGEIEELEVDDKQKEIAIKAAKAVGAIWAGVDVMDKKGKLVVIEVNSSPGTEGIEKATGKKVTETVLNYVIDKSHWKNIKMTECGYIEKIKIEKVGIFDAKMDTGNSGYCVIHADKWKKSEGEIVWDIGDKTVVSKLKEIRPLRIGGLDSRIEKRPVIMLDVSFNGEKYENVRFTFSNRKDLSTPVLMNRLFLRRASLSVNSNLKYRLSEK